MSILKHAGVDVVHHFTPLHYIPFIARAQALRCKPSLKAAGFAQSHLRSKSCKQDVERGFGRYAFLTLDKQARIACAKLAAGFPHAAIEISPDSVDAVEYHLCRYNVAMTRKLRRNGQGGFAESASNGRYYDNEQIPTARTADEKKALLAAHYPGTMIEVLVPNDFSLTKETKIVCFSDKDRALVKAALTKLEVSWAVELRAPPGNYDRREDYSDKVSSFIDQAIAEPTWLGNGLEFDRV